MSAHAARLRDVSPISRPTRRSVMVGAGAVLAAGSTVACLPLDGKDQDASGAADPDRQRVEAMAAQIEELQALLTATVLTHPRLGARLAALRECHAAHHRVLHAGPGPTPRSTPAEPTAGPAPVPTTARAALTRLRTTEEAHVSALAASAAMSQSGALARLFAVMAAGVGQHLTMLTES